MSKLLLFASVAAALVVSTNAVPTWLCFPYDATANSANVINSNVAGVPCTDSDVFCNEYPNCDPTDFAASAFLSRGRRVFCVDSATPGVQLPGGCGQVPSPAVGNIPPPNPNLFLTDSTTCFADPTEQVCVRTLCSIGTEPVVTFPPPNGIPVGDFATSGLEICDAATLTSPQFTCQNNCVEYEQEITKERTVYCVEIDALGDFITSHIGPCNVSDPSDPATPVASIPATTADCPDFAGVDPCKTCCSSTIYNASVRDVEVAGDLSIKIITEQGDDGVKVVAASEETAPGGILAPIIGLKRAVGSILRGGL